MLKELFPHALGGDGGARGCNRDGGDDPPSGLPDAIKEVTVTAAQWHLLIDRLLAHTDAAIESLDLLEDRAVRIALRRQLKDKRGALQQAGRDLTLQIRTLSRYTAVAPVV
jgi:hypothetical protein